MYHRKIFPFVRYIAILIINLHKIIARFNINAFKLIFVRINSGLIVWRIITLLSVFYSIITKIFLIISCFIFIYEAISITISRFIPSSIVIRISSSHAKIWRCIHQIFAINLSHYGISFVPQGAAPIQRRTHFIFKGTIKFISG